ncbi:MAG: uracil phosphoribosyltransferase [Planctomycetaceae bacterium]
MVNPRPETVHVLDNHSLVRHHMSMLRDVSTAPAAFRQHVKILSLLLLAEATRDLRMRDCAVTTPMEAMQGQQLAGRIAAVPILRAGLGMTAAVTELIPDVEVRHLGFYRDEQTAQPVRYYDKLPAGAPADVALLLDPMLATGGSACMAIETLREWGVGRIVMLSIIAAPEGIRLVTERFPDVIIYTCVIDRELNDRRFILPGLGDAGDRMFNTVGE